MLNAEEVATSVEVHAKPEPIELAINPAGLNLGALDLGFLEAGVPLLAMEIIDYPKFSTVVIDMLEQKRSHSPRARARGGPS